MNCPVCELPAKGHFCSNCGHDLPYVVGESYPFGIRFPESKGKAYMVAIETAKAAPIYREEAREGILYHYALYDRVTIRGLVQLLKLLEKVFRGEWYLIENTTDGETFHSNYMQ